MGGTIAKKGGQNPLEAARYGSKIFHGPDIKNFPDIFRLLKNLNIFLDLGHHLMIGVSRKSLIKRLIKTNTLTPSVVLAVDAYTKGAKILRVHDVQETKEAINIFKRAN